MPDSITINKKKIGLGEHAEIFLNIARLPTYTNIDLPVYVYRAEEDGPVLLLTGGLHGDEINGIEIIRRLIDREKIVPERGTVIAMPVVNVYGFIQNVRGLPDGKDINRSFPGSKGGSLAKLLAYTLMNEIIPQIDYGIDFHTGGSARANFPQIRCTLNIPKNKELAKAFAPPIIINSALINKSFRKAAKKKGKHILVYESGESLRYDESGIEEGMNGTMRVMKHLDMIDSAPDPNDSEVFYKTTWVRAKYAGLFSSKIELGEKVNKRQVLGHINDPFGQEWFKSMSPQNGRVIGLNNTPVVHKGDALVHLAYNLNK
ncbi:succinylglutamate desuccinylase/aspartoacylase family protein [Balneolaceae bacterium YR4-1]|uniref:Succinylglutamate desuccinylase/aspartoacylase family protein n=1 Tax=Halalkalibaculum roseum TaxID=2709311 RepID=A0A6M1SWD0_9BACT|nr:succinylglutamate desuccinylase/aspartoacylase family protein [Halalkalibaculum roseum]NGP76396.1 succinylglutamate desuccinylase/aspartoacylase family protein [Halalkalibaculum roseum]